MAKPDKESILALAIKHGVTIDHDGSKVIAFAEDLMRLTVEMAVLVVEGSTVETNDSVGVRQHQCHVSAERLHRYFDID